MTPEAARDDATAPRAGLGGTVLFIDAVGTLFGLLPPLEHLKSLLAEAGYPIPEDDLRHALRVEMTWYRAHSLEADSPAELARLRLESGELLLASLQADRVVGLSVERAADLLAKSMQMAVFPDVAPALETLRQRGWRLGVVSNYDIRLRTVLADLGILDPFETITVSAEVGFPKPDRRIFDEALREMGVSAEAALHVGDSIDIDVVGARNAGIRAILLDRSGLAPPADAVAVIRHFGELVDVVGEPTD